MRNGNIPFYAGRLWIGAWFPNAWAGEANFAEEQMEVDYVKFTPFDEVYECPDESWPLFGWAPGTSFGVDNSQQCTGGTSSPVTSPPSLSPLTRSPIAGNYLDDGCSSLPSTFCTHYISGSYCKDWNQDECGRSICQGDTHAVLKPCQQTSTTSPSKMPTNEAIICEDYTEKNDCDAQTPSCIWHQQGLSEECRTDPDWVYANEGCFALEDYDGFCSSYNSGYCKYWQADDCGRSVCHGDAHTSLNPC